MIINRSHPLSDLLSFGIIVLSSFATLILLTSYGDPTKQILGACAIAVLCVFVLYHDKITISFLALIFFSQFSISLYTYRITSLAFLQLSSKDVFIILLAGYCFAGKAIRRYDSIAMLFTIYIVWNMITIGNSFYPVKSKIEIITLVKYLLVYLCCLNMPKNNKLLRGLMWVMVAIVAIQSLIGILQYIKGSALGLGFIGEKTTVGSTDEEFYYEGTLRVAGTAGVVNTFSLLLSMLLAPIIYFTFQTKKTLFYPVISAGVLTLLLTFSRAGWVSFFFGYLVVLLLIFMKNKESIKKLVILNLILTIILALIASVFIDKVKGRFTDKVSTGAAEGRVTLAYQTIEVIKKYPIYGIGLGITTYLGRWNKGYISIAKLRSIFVNNQVHNGYLQIITESGIPGGIVWFIIVGNIVWFFIKTIRQKDETTNTTNIFTLGLFGSVFAFLIHINFGTEINNPMVNILFCSFLGILRNKNDS